MRIFVSLSLLATLLISSYATTAHATASDSFSCSGSLIVDDSDGFSASCDGDLSVSGTIESDKDIRLNATGTLTLNESAEIFTPTNSLFDVAGDSVVGIAPLRGSDLNLFLNDDLQVNQSRVFTSGSDLLLYPALNISAGKGVSRSSVQPPSVRIDYGTLSLDYSSSSSSSGICICAKNYTSVQEWGFVITPVPEPSTNILFFIGLALLYFSKRLQFTFLKATFHKYQRKR